MKLKNIWYIAFLSAFLISCTSDQSENLAGRPNIIFIMSDDHAYQAISAYNSELIQTPNIDRIADQGIKFTKSFVTNSICAPSRAVILTGKFSHLNGITGNSAAFDGSQETDPNEMRNLYTDPGYDQKIMELKDKLIELQKKYKDPNNWQNFMAWE